MGCTNLVHDSCDLDIPMEQTLCLVVCLVDLKDWTCSCEELLRRLFIQVLRRNFCFEFGGLIVFCIVIVIIGLFLSLMTVNEFVPDHCFNLLLESALRFFFHLPFVAFEVQWLLVYCFECAFFVTPNAHPMGSDLVLSKMGSHLRNHC